jgi:hypothetical protein
MQSDLHLTSTVHMVDVICKSDHCQIIFQVTNHACMLKEEDSNVSIMSLFFDKFNKKKL